MYKKIRSHSTTLQIYAKKLIKDGLIPNTYLDLKKKEFRNFLDKELSGAKDYKIKSFNNAY